MVLATTSLYFLIISLVVEAPHAESAPCVRHNEKDRCQRKTGGGGGRCGAEAPSRQTSGGASRIDGGYLLTKYFSNIQLENITTDSWL